jgi:abortive infection bacteriophage resistance protein
MVADDNFAVEVLSQVNYYRLSAYFLPFKGRDGCYLPGTSFENIFQIYEFDRKLRNVLFRAIEAIEVNFRAKLAYAHAHKYGALGYLDAANFSARHNHTAFIERLENEINSNRKKLFVQHHLTNYNGEFPIWVVTELFTIGMLSYFYADLPVADQKVLAKQICGTTHKNMGSWLRCCTDLRNVCAHYGRLYYAIFSAVPANLPHVTPDFERRLWAAALALRALYPGTANWSSEIVESIAALLAAYAGVIDLNHIGFPEDWEVYLR